jgi:uncharacterized damage-inducible protein DinB
MAKIGLARLKNIIREEIENLHEGEDHDSASKIAKSASDLMKAIDSFREVSSEKARAEVGQNLQTMHQVLDRIVHSPMNYVDSTEPGPKVVTLKPQNKEVV